MGKNVIISTLPNISQNYLPKVNTSNIFANSLVYDDGSSVLINTTTASAFKLDVNGTARIQGAATLSGNLNLQGAVTRNINFYDSSNTNINAQIQYDQISSNSGQLFFGTNNAGTFATRLTISNTGAATFSSTLRVNDAIWAADGTSTSASIRFYNSNTGLYYPGSDALGIITNATEKVRITSGGNVGIGVTPSTWGAGWIALQIGERASIYTDSSKNTLIGNNIYYDGSNNKYISTAAAARFYIENTSQFIWQQAASGTAGNGITFRDAMRITSGGNVVLGNNTGSGWSTAGGRTTLEIYGSIYPAAIHNSSSVGNSFSYNTYWDGANWRYVSAAGAIIYIQDTEGHKFFHNGAGSAGASFTPLERMRVTSGGNALIGTTDDSAGYRLNITNNGGSGFLGVSNQSGAAGSRYLRMGFGNGATFATIQATRHSVADDVNLVLQPGGGSVGIGVDDPKLKLTVNGAIGNGLSTYPHNGRLVKTGTTSVTFTITLAYASNWNPAYATIRVAGSRTGLEEQYAAMYFLRLIYYAGSVSPVVNNVSGDTGNATVSISASAPSNSVITITITDGGTSTNYLIADLDASFNTGILSIT